MIDREILDTLERMKKILAAEREALGAGQPETLVELSAEKLAVTESLGSSLGSTDLTSASHVVRSELTVIRQMAEENAVHFQAINNGLRAAIRRLETLQSDSYVGSYGQDGGKVAFTGAVGTYQTKA